MLWVQNAEQYQKTEKHFDRFYYIHAYKIKQKILEGGPYLPLYQEINILLFTRYHIYCITRPNMSEDLNYWNC